MKRLKAYIEDRLWDRRLHIDTAGRDATTEDGHRYAYEPTPYCVLEKLIQSDWLMQDNVLLDYGCGKGRVGIFAAIRTGCRSIGVDFNERFIAAAQRNRDAAGLQGQRDGSSAPAISAFPAAPAADFVSAYAEVFEVPDNVDRCYFFNPFSVQLLQSVTERIIESYCRAPRRILLMFYYPSDSYMAYLMSRDELSFVDEIDCSDVFPGDGRERIVCFEIDQTGGYSA